MKKNFGIRSKETWMEYTQISTNPDIIHIKNYSSESRGQEEAGCICD